MQTNELVSRPFYVHCCSLHLASMKPLQFPRCLRCIDLDSARATVPGHYELCVCEPGAVPMSQECQGWHHLGHLEVFGPFPLNRCLARKTLLTCGIGFVGWMKGALFWKILNGEWGGGGDFSLEHPLELGFRLLSREMNITHPTRYLAGNQQRTHADFLAGRQLGARR